MIPTNKNICFHISALFLDCNGSMNFVQQPFWPSIVMKKWLNLQPKVSDFSEDEIDTETESEDDGTMMLHFAGTMFRFQCLMFL